MLLKRRLGTLPHCRNASIAITSGTSSPCEFHREPGFDYYVLFLRFVAFRLFGGYVLLFKAATNARWQGSHCQRIAWLALKVVTEV